jgi:hypothetical protein
VLNILPFRNNFLTVRNASAMSKAKADLSVALNMANASMSYWYGAGGTFTAEAKTNHQWAKDALSTAKSAFDSSGVFYFPKNLPESEAGSVWPNQTTADYGVNLAQFFTPGAFTLPNLFTTELGGRAPSLYKIKWYTDRDNGYTAVITDEHTLVSAPIEGTGGEQNVVGTNNSAYGLYSLEVNTAHLKAIFPTGFSEFGDRALLYKVFPTIPLWPSRPTYFMGTNNVAKNLYQYYHWR